MGDFAKEYGYPVPNTFAPDEDWKRYDDAWDELVKRGLIEKEHYARPCGKGWQSWYWRFKPVLWGDALEVADKYIAAMQKHGI